LKADNIPAEEDMFFVGPYVFTVVWLRKVLIIEQCLSNYLTSYECTASGVSLQDIFKPHLEGRLPSLIPSHVSFDNNEPLLYASVRYQVVNERWNTFERKSKKKKERKQKRERIPTHA
jgi:hypothetical protein